MSWGHLFSSSLLGWPSLMPWGCIFLCLTIKQSYNTGPSITSNFCCSKTEPRKLNTPPTISPTQKHTLGKEPHVAPRTGTSSTPHSPAYNSVIWPLLGWQCEIVVIAASSLFLIMMLQNLEGYSLQPECFTWLNVNGSLELCVRTWKEGMSSSVRDANQELGEGNSHHVGPHLYLRLLSLNPTIWLQSLFWSFLKKRDLLRQGNLLLPWGSVGKNPTASAGGTGIWVQFLGQEDPLEEEIAPHFCILTWKIPWTEQCGMLYSQRGHKKSDTT